MSEVTLSTACRPVFARHETFHPRYGWLRKAFIGASLGGDTFASVTAPVRLGVGKNMVNAIRYWGLAYKVLVEIKGASNPRASTVSVSPFGHALLSDDGWDPYLEDPATLWLLHWMLLRPPSLVPVWWIAFNLYPRQHFDEEALTQFAIQNVASVVGWSGVVNASIRKDVNCLIRTLVPRRSGRDGLDDLLDCPFREMHLLDAVPGEAQTVRFSDGAKQSLHPDVLGFACLDFAAREGNGARSITLPSLARGLGSPGLAFKLSEDALYGVLTEVVARMPALHLAEPAGLRQLLFDDDPGTLAERLLQRHYGSKSPALGIVSEDRPLLAIRGEQ